MRILVIDDSKTARAVLRKVLGRIGLTDITEASNGEEGLAALAGSNFDLVICDWKMPVMDGYEFVQTLNRSGPADIPVIMVSSESYMDRIIEVMRAGAHGYVRKPFSADKLQAKISEVRTKMELERERHRSSSTLTGALGEIGFPGLIQFVVSSGMSGRLEIDSQAEDAVLEFYAGELRSAYYKGLQGQDAFFALAGLEDGQFRFVHGGIAAEGSMEAPTMALLLEAMRRRDEMSV